MPPKKIKGNEAIDTYSSQEQVATHWTISNKQFFMRVYLLLVPFINTDRTSFLKPGVFRILRLALDLRCLMAWEIVGICGAWIGFEEMGHE